MLASLKRVDLYEDTFAYAGRRPNEVNADVFRSIISDSIDVINKIIDIDFDSLTIEELYQLLKQLYDISFYQDDCLEILSREFKRKYENIINIKTTMAFEDIETKGYGDNLEWWFQKYQIYLTAAVASDVDQSIFKTVQSKDHINKMLANNDIVILNESTVTKEDNLHFEEESYERFPQLDIDFDTCRDDITYFAENNIKIIEDVIRMTFTKKKVMNDLMKVINSLQGDIDRIY